MKSRTRSIGNSKGNIIPQNFLEESFIEVPNNHIIISTSDDEERKNWQEAFKRMAENGDDELLVPDLFKDEGIPDWTW